VITTVIKGRDRVTQSGFPKGAGIKGAGGHDGHRCQDAKGRDRQQQPGMTQPTTQPTENEGEELHET